MKKMLVTLALAFVFAMSLSIPARAGDIPIAGIQPTPTPAKPGDIPIAGRPTGDQVSIENISLWYVLKFVLFR